MDISELIPFVGHAPILSVRFEDHMKADLLTPAILTGGLDLGPDSDYPRRYFLTNPIDCYQFLGTDILIPSLKPWQWWGLGLLPSDFGLATRVLEIDYDEVTSRIQWPMSFHEDGMEEIKEDTFLYTFSGDDSERLNRECILAIKSLILGDLDQYKSYVKQLTIEEPPKDFLDPDKLAALRFNEPTGSEGEIEGEEEFGEEEVVAEGVLDARLKQMKPVSKGASLDPNKEAIRAYLIYRERSERVPILMGHTAVAKSSMVKEVVKELDNPKRRFVDIRCSFIDKMDIEGLKWAFVDHEKGMRYSDSAPPSFLFTCTDEYIQYMADIEPKVKALLDKQPAPSSGETPTAEERAQKKQLLGLKRVLKRVQNLKKWPVIFFDEFTRAQPAIINAFVQILNQKAYMGRKFTKARVLGATNYPIDMQDEKWKGLYAVDRTKDQAIYARVEPMPIHPQDVFTRWLEWAQKPKIKEIVDPDTGDVVSMPQSPPRQNIHPLVLEFIGKNHKRAYDMGFAVREIEAGMEKTGAAKRSVKDLGATPFPNFRTWDFVSGHLYAVQAGIEARKKDENAQGAHLDTDMIRGYIGSNPVTDEFILFIQSKMPEASRVDEGDILTDAVSNAFHSNTPICMLGMSSIGKTTRVKELEHKHDCKVIAINLAQKDRVDVMGAPQPVPVFDGLTLGISPLLGSDPEKGIKSGLEKELEGIFREAMPEGFPEMVTSMAPDRQLAVQIQQALDKHEKVVLFFDEVNRASPLTMAAVFEAVSDNRFGGVEFDPDRVVIMAAANYGEKYAGVQHLDPAMAARFSIVKKMEFDDDDLNSVIRYMQNHKDEDGRADPYVEVVQEFILRKAPLDPATGRRDLKVIRAMFEQVEERTLMEAAPSLRAFSDLDKLVKQVKTPQMQGRMLSGADLMKLRLPPGGFRSFQQALEVLENLPSNWAGYAAGDFDEGGKRVPVRNKIEQIKEFLAFAIDAESKQLDIPEEERQAAYKMVEDILPLLKEKNQEIEEYRKKEFVKVLGPTEGPAFLKLFNATSGYGSQLKIEDLTSKVLVREYVEALYKKLKDVNDRPNMLQEFVLKYWTYWSAKGSTRDKDQEILRTVIRLSGAAAQDDIRPLVGLYRITSKPIYKAFIDHVFDDFAYTQEIATKAGVWSNPDLVLKDFERWKLARQKRGTASP